MENNYNYGKRPFWQWIALYVIIGAVAYGLIYYFYFYSNSEYNQNPQTQNQNNNQNIMEQPMKIEVLQEGTGTEVKTGDMVTVNYTGTLLDGTKFDSSLNPGREPFQFTVDESAVIQGWHDGLKGMKVGEKRKLTIPPDLAYGPSGRPPVVPPNATLIFEIDLLKIN